MRCGAPTLRTRRHLLLLLNSWVQLTTVLNELSRSMGQPDFYPFVLPRAAVAKLQLIHCVVTEARPQPPATPASAVTTAGRSA